MPALSRAVALQAKAGKVGFDWNDARLVLAKIRAGDKVDHYETVPQVVAEEVIKKYA